MSKRKRSIKARTNEISITQEEEELPTPETLRQYQAIDSKFAEFVIEYTKKEQDNRHETIKNINKSHYRLASGDFWLNFVMVMGLLVLHLVFILASVYLLYLGTPITAITGIGTIILSFISFAKIFIRRRPK